MMVQKLKAMDFMNLDNTSRVRVALAGTARLILILSASFLLYFLIPVDGFNESNPLAAWVRISAVILSFIGVLALQIRLVLSASIPHVRAVEAVAESVVAFVLLFALLYVSLSTSDPSSFSEPLNRIDALYFTSSTFSTVGFGDIVASSTLARGLVSLQMITGLGLLGMIAKVTFNAAKWGINRKQ